MAKELSTKTADILDDAGTHKNAWMLIFDIAKEGQISDDDQSYLEHERSALLRLLNAVESLGWMTTTTHNDGEKEVIFRPKGGQIVRGMGYDWADAVYAVQDVLVEQIDNTVKDT